MVASPFRVKNQFLVAKVEATPGTDASPGTVDAILCEPPSLDPAPQTERNPEVTGGLDSNPAFYNGGYRQGTARVRMKGSGAAGTAPDWYTLAKACGFSVTNVAADVTGTAQAVGSNTVTLAAGASAAADYYVGMVIVVAGRKARCIVDYDGTTKIAKVSPAWAVSFGDGTTETMPTGTPTYTIPAGSLLSPISTNIPYLTWKRYLQNQVGGNAVVDRVTGWQGNARFTIARAGCTVDFDGRGQFDDDQDAAWPGLPTFLNQSPPPAIGAQFFVNDVAAPVTINLDMGAQVTSESDPNAPNGFGIAAITGRETGGSIQLPRRNVAVENVNASIRAGTTNVATAIWGSVVGNRLAFTVPAFAKTGRTQSDVDGVVYDQMSIGCYGANANPFVYAY